jgi:hypothetical protein
MKATEDNELEKWVDHWMENSTLESPSSDFTANIMAQIATNTVTEATTYRPLLSSFTIFGIIISALAIILYGIINNTNSSISWIPNWNAFQNYSFWNTLQFSKVTTYCFVATTLVVFIQIPILKSYYEKRHQL